MLNAIAADAVPQSSVVQNQVLSTLNEDEFARLRPHLDRVPLRRNAVIFDANRPVDSVYFVESGIVSRVAATPQDGPVEVAIVGRFGFVGISVVLGATRALHRTVVQVPGEALRVPAEDLRRIMAECPAIRDHLLRYVQMLIGLKSQMALCNAKHSVDQRVARWLLLALDRMEADDLPVTHDFLAKMLGVRRPGVSDALSHLESAGVLSKSRATIRILRRDLLRAKACDCYGAVNERYATMRLMPRFPHCVEA